MAGISASNSAAAGVRIENAEVVGLVPGAKPVLSLRGGRTLSADAVILAPGRPEGSMPESLDRAFAPVLADGPTDKIVVDPWAAAGLASGDRRVASADRAAVAQIGLGRPAPVPARRPTAVGRASAPDAAHDRRRQN